MLNAIIVCCYAPDIAPPSHLLGRVGDSQAKVWGSDSLIVPAVQGNRGGGGGVEIRILA